MGETADTANSSECHMFCLDRLACNRRRYGAAGCSTAKGPKMDGRLGHRLFQDRRPLQNPPSRLERCSAPFG